MVVEDDDEDNVSCESIDSEELDGELGDEA